MSANQSRGTPGLLLLIFAGALLLIAAAGWMRRGSPRGTTCPEPHDPSETTGAKK